MKDLIDPNSLNDFGFTAISDAEIQKSRETETSNAKKDILSLEELILPLLQNLMESADSGDTIYWPNRKKLIKEQISKIEKITKRYK